MHIKTQLIKTFLNDHPQLTNAEVCSTLKLSRPTVTKAMNSIDVLPFPVNWDVFFDMDCSITAKIIHFYLTSLYTEERWYVSLMFKDIGTALGITDRTARDAFYELLNKNYHNYSSQPTDAIDSFSSKGKGSFHFYLPSNNPFVSADIGRQLQLRSDLHEISQHYKLAHKHRRVTVKKNSKYRRNSW